MSKTPASTAGAYTAFMPLSAVFGAHFLLNESLEWKDGVAALLWVTAGALLGAHALTPIRRRIINRASAGLIGTAAFFLARTEKAA